MGAIDTPPAGEGSLVKSSRKSLINESSTEEFVAFKSLMGTVAGLKTAIDGVRSGFQLKAGSILFTVPTP